MTALMFLLGLWVGAAVGMFVMALVVAAREGDERRRSG